MGHSELQETGLDVPFAWSSHTFHMKIKGTVMGVGGGADHGVKPWILDLHTWGGGCLIVHIPKAGWTRKRQLLWQAETDLGPHYMAWIISPCESSKPCSLSLDGSLCCRNRKIEGPTIILTYIQVRPSVPTVSGSNRVYHSSRECLFFACNHPQTAPASHACPETQVQSLLGSTTRLAGIPYNTGIPVFKI